MKVISKGTALGKAKIISYQLNNRDNISFFDAIDLSLRQIDEIKINSPENSEYLDVQKFLIADPIFKDEVLKLVESGNSAIFSVKFVLGNYIKELAKTNDEYLKERILDIEDVMNRIISNLSGDKELLLTDKRIVVIEDLHPSFLIKNKKNVLGVISRKGGITSHSAILCRGLNIPYVISDVEINEDDFIILADDIYINPSKELIDKYKTDSLDVEAIKHDGVRFYANVFSNDDLVLIDKYGFDGVGLYRTEFIFMNNDKPLSYEEQYKIYKEALTITNKDIIFRTFDVGDDKKLSYLNVTQKGVSNYFDNLDIFNNQIKALVNAKAKYIMFPMIRSKDEVDRLRNIIYAYDRNIAIGIMLETKEALDNINDFSYVDFISIGTNDLVEELYKIDRYNQLDNLEYIDDLLKKLENVVEFCQNNKIELSLCGEIAGIEEIAVRLFKIGIKKLSVGVSKIGVLNNAYLKYINE